MKILVIIPARGGSKGIPRKNIRPMNGLPLISYSIRTALESKYKPIVFVTTDDDEIAFFSKKFGAFVHKRQKNLAQDSTTLDPVIIDAYKNIVNKLKLEFDLIITLQPTSPCLKTDSLDKAINKIVENEEIDTILSVKESKHLTWSNIGYKFKPNYIKRLNRQELQPIYQETGGFLICKRNNISKGTRIGKNINIHILKDAESIDIDNIDDWNICENNLKKKLIVFRVAGYKEIGLGHVYNTLLIANQILNHQILFLVDTKSNLAFNKIKESNYKVIKQKKIDIADDIILLNPDIVINDCLDTTKLYIQKLKNNKIKVINFEDLGEGSKIADFVFNPIYPKINSIKNQYFGHKYFCIRDEFSLHEKIRINTNIKNVVIAFGGTDPNNLSLKVLSSIHQYCQNNSINIILIAGIGYTRFDKLKRFENIIVYKNIKNISDYFSIADIAFSACGRTIYELASLGIPTIVMGQNPREMTHYFASRNHGFLNLGLGINVNKKTILNSFTKLAVGFEERKSMSKKMLSFDLKNGKNRVVNIINKIISK